MVPDVEGERFRLLFVCSGNTCRSPLAEAIARRRLETLGWGHVEVRSAGAAAAPGSPASEGASAVAERHGLDLSRHSATPLSEDLVAWADLVLGMGAGHALRALQLGGDEKTALLTTFARGEESVDTPDGEDVPDPFGGDVDEYERTYEVLELLVSRTLARLESILAP